MKYLKSTLATLFFIALLLITYYVHISLFKVDVVLYSAAFDGIVAAAIAAALLCGLHFFRLLSAFEKIQLIVIWVLAGYIFAISFPAVIDRSLSFYILEKLQQRGGGNSPRSLRGRVHEGVRAGTPLGRG